jgi:hypothetical protein
LPRSENNAVPCFNVAGNRPERVRNVERVDFQIGPKGEFAAVLFCVTPEA